jgi:predicted nucleic acid-binding protein
VSFLLDTNIVSAWLSYPAASRRHPDGSKTVAYKRAHDRVNELEEVYFSALTRWEIERGLTWKGWDKRLLDFAGLCRQSRVLRLDDRIVDQAVSTWAAVKHAGDAPKDVDILILATAQVWQLVLVTNDEGLQRAADLQQPPVVWEDWLAVAEG